MKTERLFALTPGHQGMPIHTHASGQLCGLQGKPGALVPGATGGPQGGRGAAPSLIRDPRAHLPQHAQRAAGSGAPGSRPASGLEGLSAPRAGGADYLARSLPGHGGSVGSIAATFEGGRRVGCECCAVTRPGPPSERTRDPQCHHDSPALSHRRPATLRTHASDAEGGLVPLVERGIENPRVGGLSTVRGRS